MTGNLVLDLLISLGGVLFVVAASVALGAGRLPPLTAGAVLERLAFEEPDFAPSGVEVGVDGRAAIAFGQGEEIALAFRAGDRISTRRVLRGQVEAEAGGNLVVLRMHDFSVPDTSFAAGEPSRARMIADRLAAPAGA